MDAVTAAVAVVVGAVEVVVVAGVAVLRLDPVDGWIML